MSTARTAQRRVLVVAYDFPPHAAIGTMRTLRVVRELHAQGWQVSVLTGDPASYLPGTPVDPALLVRVPADVRVIRAGALRPYNRFQDVLLSRFRGGRRFDPDGALSRGRTDSEGPATSRQAGQGRVLTRLARMKDVVDAALSIPDRESGWLLPALTKGTWQQVGKSRPDVIYSSAPPWTGQLVAAGLKLTIRRPWVADFRDPWSRAPWREDRFRFALRATARLERFVIRHADRVIFVAAANRDDFVAHYGRLAASKFHVVANGCDPTEFDTLRQTSVSHDGPFVMLHAGSLYAGRTPVPLLKAIAVAIARGSIRADRFRLRFLGANSLQGVDLPAICQELGLQGVVEFLPRVPREHSLRAMMSASSLLLLQPGHTISVPGKVYEYLATGRPIFAIAEEGETARLVREAGAGVSVTPGNDAAIVDALETLVNRGYTPAAPPRREFFDGNARAADIVRILETTVQSRRPSSALISTELP